MLETSWLLQMSLGGVLRFYVVLWDSIPSQVRGTYSRTQGADPHPCKKNKSPINQSINQSPATDQLSFVWEVIKSVCRSQKPIFGFRCPYCSTMCAFSHSNVRLLFLFLLFFIKCPGSLTNLTRCKDVGLLNRTPGFFFYMVVFVWKKKRSLFYTQIWCKKKKKFI